MRQALEMLGVDSKNINFSKGGTSRSAMNKSKKATAAAINAVSMVLNPHDPNGGQAHGMAKAVEIAPNITPATGMTATGPLSTSSGKQVQEEAENMPPRSGTQSAHPDINAVTPLDGENTSATAQSVKSSSTMPRVEERKVSASKQQKIDAVKRRLGPMLIE
jgi:hypothetical protein